MDVNESLDKLRGELHAYHVDVKLTTKQLELTVKDVATIHADMYGIPGQKDSTGIMGTVAGLCQSRKMLRLGLRGAWVVLTVLLGAAAAWALK